MRAARGSLHEGDPIRPWQDTRGSGRPVSRRARNSASHLGDAGLQGEAAILEMVSYFNMLDNLIRNSSLPVTVSFLLEANRVDSSERMNYGYPVRTYGFLRHWEHTRISSPFPPAAPPTRAIERLPAGPGRAPRGARYRCPARNRIEYWPGNRREREKGT